MLQIFANSKKACQELSNSCIVPTTAINCKDLEPADLGIMVPKLKGVCLCAGMAILKKFAQAGYIGKNLVLGSVRGKMHLFDNAKVVFTHDPYVSSQDHQASIDAECDVKLAERIELTGTDQPKLGEYVYVETFTTLCKYVKVQGTKDNPVFLTCDLETTGLIYSNPSTWIVSISFTYTVGKSQVRYFGYDKLDMGSELHNQINWLLTTNRVKIGGANFKYDVHWLLAKWNITCTNFTLDTNLLGSLLDENASNSLDTHAKRFTTMGGYADSFNVKYDKGKMELVPKKDMLPYCLSYDSLVRLEDGTWAKIGKLVYHKYSGRLYCFNGDTVVFAKVIGWHTNKHTGRWFQVVTPSVKKGRWGYLGPCFTEEHELLTKRGKIQVKDIEVGVDKILTAEYQLSPDAIQIVLASLLGDGGISSRNGVGTALRLGQCNDRRGYLQWKINSLCELGGFTQVSSSPDMARYSSTHKKCLTALKTKYPRQHSSKHRYRKLKITQELLNELGALGLAIWYMDDGTLPKSGGSRIVARKVDKNEQALVISWLYAMGVRDVNYNENNGFFQIKKNSMVVFHKLILPYMHPDCAYKSIYAEKVEAPSIQLNWKPYYESITKIVEYQPTKSRPFKHKYCLTVDTYHNFQTAIGFVGNCGGDTDACFRVAEVLKTELLKDPALARFYVKLLHPSVRAFERVEQNGILVDKEYMNNLRVELEKVIAGLEVKALGLMSRFLQYKYAGESGGKKNLRLSRPKVIKDFMFGPRGLNLTPLKVTPKSKEPSTAIEHLMMFAAHPKAEKFIEHLKLHNSAAKTLSTYVIGFMKHLNEDGKFHPSFQFFKGDFGSGKDAGTNTGRSSAVAPAIQTLPKHTKWAKKLRKAYIAPPGWYIVNWDFSQGELRIAADMANETTMLRMYKDNVDQHMATGGKMLGYSISDMLDIKGKDSDLFDKIRQQGKAGNFGLLYGMSAKGFMEYSRVTFGVIITLKQAEQMRNAFFDLYPGLLTWHDSQIKLAYANGMVRSPLGRVRHLPMIYSKDQEIASKARRQSINAPVQATLSDLTIYALSRIVKTVKPEFFDYCKFHCFTHDSLTAYVYGQGIPIVVSKVTTIMETLPLEEEFGWKPKVFFKVDSEVGTTLADLMKYDKWMELQKNKITWKHKDDLPW